jgi:hypothetical protein
MVDSILGVAIAMRKARCFDAAKRLQELNRV